MGVKFTGSKGATSRGFLVQTTPKLVLGNLTHARHNLFTSKRRHNLKFAKRKQTTAINIDCLKTRRNNLKSLALVFQAVIHFHPGHLQPKTLVDSFSALI